MKNAILFAAAFALIVLLVACDNGGGTTPGPDRVPAPTVDADSEGGIPSPGETPAETPNTPAETPTVPAQVCQPNPSPATPEDQVLDEPSEGDAVTSPVTISGRVVANEATFQVTIYDPDGNPLADTFGMSQQTDVGQLAPFSIDVAFDVDEATLACIWVYELSARDGSQIDVGQIPVTLSP